MASEHLEWNRLRQGKGLMRRGQQLEWNNCKIKNW